jgi:hypothetical protein
VVQGRQITYNAFVFPEKRFPRLLSEVVVMKYRLLFIALMMTGAFFASAEEPIIVFEATYDSAFALALDPLRSNNIAPSGGARDYDKSCDCRCTAQGILLRECGDEVENLGNYGNIKNCLLHKEDHPRCN